MPHSASSMSLRCDVTLLAPVRAFLASIGGLVAALIVAGVIHDVHEKEKERERLKAENAWLRMEKRQLTEAIVVLDKKVNA